MLKSIMQLARGSLALVLVLSLSLSPVNTLLAQIDDTEPPVLIHRQIEAGVAGELQTFLARVSDDFEISEVNLFYRQNETGEFTRIEMRPLLDSIGEYMIAVETSPASYEGLQYYIEAVDTSGNKTNRGFAFAPIVMPLNPPGVATAAPEPEPVVDEPVVAQTPPEAAPPEAAPPEAAPEVTQAEQQSGGLKTSTVLIGVGIGALLVVGALAGAGGSDDDDSPSAEETDNPDTGNPDTVTLTIVSEVPSAN